MNEKNIKNIAGKFLVLTFLLFGFVSFVNAENCTDSDGGLNYYVKGNATGCNDLSSAVCDIVTLPDTCLQYDSEGASIWAYSGERVQELSCVGEELSVSEYTCPNGCVDGACVRVGCLRYDFDCDGVVNNLDFGILVELYGGNHLDRLYEENKNVDNILREIWGDRESCDNLDNFFSPWKKSNKSFSLEDLITIGTEVLNCNKENDYNCTDFDGGLNIFTKGPSSFTNSDGEYFESEDLCLDNSTLIENICGPNIVYIKCPNGCSNGACTKISPTDKPIDIPEDIDLENQVFLCQGCVLGEKCYPISYRKSGKFYSDDGSFIEQQEKDSVCENNFECSSNVCISGKCIDEGFIQKVISWFTRLFTRN